MPCTECYDVVPHLLSLFGWQHLPSKLQEVSRPFADLAVEVAKRAPFNYETSVALRKLLEAKDCAVRAAL